MESLQLTKGKTMNQTAQDALARIKASLVGKNPALVHGRAANGVIVNMTDHTENSPHDIVAVCQAIPNPDQKAKELLAGCQGAIDAGALLVVNQASCLTQLVKAADAVPAAA